jgi:hypothetical protein
MSSVLLPNRGCGNHNFVQCCALIWSVAGVDGGFRSRHFPNLYACSVDLHRMTAFDLMPCASALIWFI